MCQTADFAVCGAGATGAVVLAGAKPVGCGGNGVSVATIFLLVFQSASSAALVLMAGAITTFSVFSSARPALSVSTMPWVAAFRRLRLRS